MSEVASRFCSDHRHRLGPHLPQELDRLPDREVHLHVQLLLRPGQERAHRDGRHLRPSREDAAGNLKFQISAATYTSHIEKNKNIIYFFKFSVRQVGEGRRDVQLRPWRPDDLPRVPAGPGQQGKMWGGRFISTFMWGKCSFEYFYFSRHRRRGGHRRLGQGRQSQRGQGDYFSKNYF